MFKPHLEILPPQQRNLWPELAELPRHFVLYGGTGLALRLGHRASVDFDFFTSEDVVPEDLLRSEAVLKGAKVLQNAPHTLSVVQNRGGPIKLSFFGKLTLGRVGVPQATDDGVMHVASLLDLAGTKAAVIYLRSERKDYLDILALLDAGVSLSQAMGAASAIYGEQYNPALTLKALSYFGDGDLPKLDDDQKQRLTQLAASQSFSFQNIARDADRVSP